MPRAPQLSASALTQGLIDAFQARRPIRSASLIVTVFGDCILPRGGSLWLGSLTAAMALFRIEPGLVRTALSRLTGEGLFERRREGRSAFYSLSAQGREAFEAASRRIYGAPPAACDGRWTLVVAPEPEARAAARDRLSSSGGAELAPGVFIAPGAPDGTATATAGFVFAADLRAPDAWALVRAAWPVLEPLALQYRAFADRYGPLAQALALGVGFSDEQALVCRVLLVHDWRRIVLRDPGLPDALLPGDWPGREARAVLATAYRALHPLAERWLDREATGPEGPLPSAPAPDARLAGTLRTLRN